MFLDLNLSYEINHQQFFCIIQVLFSIFLSHTALGAQKVPIDFENYHSYTVTVKYIKDVAQVYPDITSLLEIGKSTMGRSIYVLFI